MLPAAASRPPGRAPSSRPAARASASPARRTGPPPAPPACRRRGTRAGASRCLRAARPRGAGSPGRTSARPLEAEQRLAHERSDRVVVAALLDEDGRQPERAEERAGLAEAAPRHLERALRVLGRGVDAERDDEGLGPLLAYPAGQLAHRGEPLLIVRTGRAPLRRPI